METNWEENKAYDAIYHQQAGGGQRVNNADYGLLFVFNCEE